jgi:hypothetical protein
VITKDDRIRYRAIEREALVRAGVSAFIFTGKDRTAQELAGIFLKALPRVRRTIRKNPGAFIARISLSSQVTLL